MNKENTLRKDKIKKLEIENTELKIQLRKIQRELDYERELNRHKAPDGTLEPILQLVEYRSSMVNENNSRKG